MPTFSRERARWILWPLHRNWHTTTINMKGRQMYLVEVERIRHVSNVERLDMWRKFSIRSERI